MKLTDKFQLTNTWMYRHARPLELARWQYHFEQGTKEAVLVALSAYQNEDGGFAHALEADSWNPYSSPIQTWVATTLLSGIEYFDESHPLIQGILKYLSRKESMHQNTWDTKLPSNNNYPHAPWWTCIEYPPKDVSYNPTAALAGFGLLCFAVDSPLYRKCESIILEAISYLSKVHGQIEMHEAVCFIQLLDYLERAEKKHSVGFVDIADLECRLRGVVSSCITQDTTKWNGYICKPSRFIKSKDSLFYEEHKDLAQYEVSYLLENQLANGSWAVPWAWNDYPSQWAISEVWWKANITIDHMLFIRNMRL